MPIAAIASAAACHSITQMLSSAVGTAAASSVSACAGRPSASAAPQPSVHSARSACWSPQAHLLGEFEWVAAFGESTKSLRRSFRDVLAEGLAFHSKGDCCDSWLTAAAPPAPTLRRDASTSSTPTAALSDAEDDDNPSRCSSPSTFSFSSGDFSAEWAEDDWPLSSAADTAAAATNPPAQPLDLSSHCGEVDWDAWAAEEEKTAAAAEAAAAAQSRLFSGGSVAKHLHLGDVAYDSRVGRIVTSACSHSSERVVTVRTRHRHSLGMFAHPRPYNWKSRPCSSHSDLHYWRPSTKDGLNVARLQQGAKAGFNNHSGVPAQSQAGRLRRPVSNPFESDGAKQKDGANRQKQNDIAERRSNGKSTGAHKQARATTHAARHSLAAPTRPAMESASAAHRLVLQQRVTRKTQLAQSAAHPTRMPKHMRPHSRQANSQTSRGAREPTNPSELSRSDVTTRHCLDFDSFRRAFYEKHRAAMEKALHGYGRGVVDIRLAPIASHASARFMKRLQSLHPRSEEEVPLVYHGTRVDRMDSILRRGLLVPNVTPGGGGVRVANGSAYGVGIYTSKGAGLSTSYTHGTTTMFVCAAITTGAHDYSHSAASAAAGPPAIVCGDIVVLMDESRVCPLFLLDFEDGGGGRFSYGSSIKVRGQAPRAPTALLRVMLRRMHTKIRATGASNAHTVMRLAAQQEQLLQD